MFFLSTPNILRSQFQPSSWWARWFRLLMEEAGFRGYLQVALERDFNIPVAVLLSSLFFALAHLNHGVLVPKLLVYFLVGVTFSTLAWLTDSILPVIPVQIMGDLTFSS
jgi:membrane protease YdiL (CAAX protease family)